MEGYLRLFTDSQRELPQDNSGALYGNIFITFECGIFRFSKFENGKFDTPLPPLWLDLSKLAKIYKPTDNVTLD